MTTERKYKCNLCRDEISPSQGSTREGLGIHYHGNTPQASRPWLSFKRASECENHICMPCARAVHDELRKVMAASEVTA